MTIPPAAVAIPQRISLQAAQPEPYRRALALSAAISRSGLERSLLDLVEVRVSQLNGCAFCLQMHTQEASEHGERESRLHALGGWQEASVFTARERAALALAEALTLVREGHVPEGVWEAACEQFDEAQRGALILAASMMNFWNRAMIASRTTPGRPA